MNKRIPKRTYEIILNALGGGAVPKEGLGYIAVGREREIDSLLRDLDIIKHGGATFRFIVGDYGSGKTFLLETIKEKSVRDGFIVAEAELSPDRSLIGTSTKKKGLATYRELMVNISNKTHQSGKALEKVLDSWINKMFEEAVNEVVRNNNGVVDDLESSTKKVMIKKCSSLQDMCCGFEFVQALKLFWDASRTDDIEKKNLVIRWFRGNYNSNSESKNAIGINATVNDDNWFDYIILWSQLFVIAGYKGFVLQLDEMVNIYKMTNKATRQKNYEKILSMYNATLQGNAENLGIIMAGTPQSVYDNRKGVFSYKALESRLADGVPRSAGFINVMSPIITINPLSKEEVLVLLEKLAEIYTDYYDSGISFTEEEMGEFVRYAFIERGNTRITPRTMIRDFLQILNIKSQNQSSSMHSILMNYELSNDENMPIEELE